MSGGISNTRNIGEQIAIVTSVEPQSSAAATVEGASVDRYAHNDSQSCVLHQAVGADSGAPATISVQSQLQDSPDNSTWANYVPPASGSALTPAVTAIDAESSVNIDLSGANRYIRAVMTIAFTGGTTPTVLVAADIVLGGEGELPAA